MDHSCLAVRVAEDDYTSQCRRGVGVKYFLYELITLVHVLVHIEDDQSHSGTSAFNSSGNLRRRLHCWRVGRLLEECDHTLIS